MKGSTHEETLLKFQEMDHCSSITNSATQCEKYEETALLHSQYVYKSSKPSQRSKGAKYVLVLLALLMVLLSMIFFPISF
jgi:hypothetical protein